MKLHHRLLVLLTVFCTLFGTTFSTTAFAAEVSTPLTMEVGVVDEVADDSAVPYGSLSGYGNVWHNVGDPAKRSSVPVNGIPWYQGHLTVSLENFDSNTKLKIWVFSPITDSSGTKNQVIFYRENVTINDGPWENISFNPAPTGTYWVQCEVMSNDSAGRVNCWIY